MSAVVNPFGGLDEFRADMRARGMYYTPPALASWMAGFIPRGVCSVYDPAVGAGALLRAFPPGVRLCGADINPVAVEYASKNLINADIRCADTLTAPAFGVDEKFTAVIANPPYSIKWEPWDASEPAAAFLGGVIPTGARADWAFIARALQALTPTGVAVILSAPGVTYRGGREQKQRRHIIEQGWLDQVWDVPANTFEDTAIATVLLVFDMARDKTAPVIFGDKATGQTVTVTPGEIKAQDWVLVPRYYLPDNKPAPAPVDPIELETRARATIAKNLDTSLALSAHAETLTPTGTFTDHLANLSNIINKHTPARA